MCSRAQCLQRHLCALPTAQRAGMTATRALRMQTVPRWSSLKLVGMSSSGSHHAVPLTRMRRRCVRMRGLSVCSSWSYQKGASPWLHPCKCTTSLHAADECGNSQAALLLLGHPPCQEREALLQRAAGGQEVRDYAGWRRSLKGTRFRLRGVRLFNVTELDGAAPPAWD